MSQYEAVVPIPDREEEEYTMLMKCNVKYPVRYENTVTLAIRGGTKKDNFDESFNNFAYIF